MVISVNSDEDLPATVAHEIGHTVGLGDEYNGGSFNCQVNPPPKSYVGRDFNRKVQGQSFSCSESTEPDARAMPAKGSGVLIRAEMAHPFDPTSRGPLGDSLGFMGASGRQADYWVTQRSYDHIFNQLRKPAMPPMPPPVGRVANAAGFISRAGGMDTAGVSPWTTYEGPLPTPPAAESAYTIRAVDSRGQTLASQNISVDFTVPFEPPQEVDEVPFSVTIPYPDGTAKFQIRKGDRVLHEVRASPNAPTVTVTAPAAGAMLSGEGRITWTAADADGDQLSYEVEYSDDNGRTWMVLDTELSETSLEVDFDELAGTREAIIRVTATDGINTTTAQSGVFSVPAKKPEVFIDYPEDGETFVRGEDVVLEGAAEDYQDDDIESENKLRWTSDIDGPLGGGPLLHTDSLSAGKHKISLTATNSQNLTASESVTITITPGPAGLCSDPVAGGLVRCPRSGCSIAGAASGSPRMAGALALLLCWTAWRGRRRGGRSDQRTM